MTTAAQPMTDAEATDEAVLLLTRKLRRLHPTAFRDLMDRLPEGAREALHFADQRADTRRAAQGVPAEWPTRFEALADEE